jgi:hypothetical protein
MTDLKEIIVAINRHITETYPGLYSVVVIGNEKHMTMGSNLDVPSTSKFLREALTCSENPSLVPIHDTDTALDAGPAHHKNFPQI